MISYTLTATWWTAVAMFEPSLAIVIKLVIEESSARVVGGRLKDAVIVFKICEEK